MNDDRYDANYTLTEAEIKVLTKQVDDLMKKYNDESKQIEKLKINTSINSAIDKKYISIFDDTSVETDYAAELIQLAHCVRELLRDPENDKLHSKVTAMLSKILDRSPNIIEDKPLKRPTIWPTIDEWSDL